MSFLRRILGGSGEPEVETAPVDPAAAEREDVERDRELLRAEAERTSGDLISRQLRYADRSWTPPAQGSSRRADDTGADEE